MQLEIRGRSAPITAASRRRKPSQSSLCRRHLFTLPPLSCAVPSPCCSATIPGPQTAPLFTPCPVQFHLSPAGAVAALSSSIPMPAPFLPRRRPSSTHSPAAAHKPCRRCAQSAVLLSSARKLHRRHQLLLSAMASSPLQQLSLSIKLSDLRRKEKDE